MGKEATSSHRGRQRPHAARRTHNAQHTQQQTAEVRGCSLWLCGQQEPRANGSNMGRTPSRHLQHVLSGCPHHRVSAVHSVRASITQAECARAGHRCRAPRTLEEEVQPQDRPPAATEASARLRGPSQKVEPAKVNPRRTNRRVTEQCRPAGRAN